MVDTNFPKNFPSCPKCGSERTVINVAAESLVEDGTIKKDTFLSMRKLLTPLVAPTMVALTIPAVLTHWDVCYYCGTEYVTRVEFTSLPIKFQGPGQQLPPGFNPQSFNPFSQG